MIAKTAYCPLETDSLDHQLPLSAMAILMKTASAKWCTVGAISGLIGGIATWILTAYITKDEITIATLGGDYPFLYSNIVSICFSGLVAIAGSMVEPDLKFDWSHLGAQLPLVDDMPPPNENGRTNEEVKVLLTKSYWNSVYAANFLFLFLCLLLPVALYLSGVVFGKTGFGIWLVVFMAWCFLGGLSVIILPVTDFKKDMAAAAAKNKAESMGQ